MKAYLIDVKNKLIKSVEMTTDWKEISQLIGCDIFACPHVTAEGDGLYCDDEGLLKPVEGFFLLDSYPQPIAGNGLILGIDEEGESVDAKVDLITLSSRIKFMDMQDAYEWSLKQSFEFN